MQDLKDIELNKVEYDNGWKIVSTWDFTLTKKKLQEPAYAGWSVDRIEKAELDYKRYLAITKATQFQPVPNGDIDRFWHEHILDTRRYAEDCFELFGGFLHHYPYFGMRGDSDKETWTETAKFSHDLWVSLYHEDLYSVDTKAQKCPQACPGGATTVQEAQKCPQACPGGATTVQEAQKCPQACPGGATAVQEAQTSVDQSKLIKDICPFLNNKQSFIEPTYMFRP